ncbi:MAG: hypothetical protein ACLQVL_08360 [Terriglobia bacterium]
MSLEQPAFFFLSLTVMFLLLLSPCVRAQDVPKLQLIIRERNPVAAGAFMRYFASSPPECDSAGNVYVQVAQPAPAVPGVEPITRISPDGRHVTAFSFESIPALAPRSHIDTFAVSPRGEVCSFGHNGNIPEFITFRDDGQFDSASRIDPDIYSAQMAVFATGEFLLRGIKVSGPPGKTRDDPFTGIFDRNGKLLKEITLQDDVQFKTRADFKDDAEYRKKDRAAREAFWTGQAFSADDGNVYLVRPSKAAVVDVLSPVGEVVRRLTLNPPDPSFKAGSVKVAGGTVVVEFFYKVPGDPQNTISQIIYSVFDSEKGDKLYDYEGPSGLMGIFACYTPDHFTFLDVDDKGLSLVHAAAR